MIFKFLLQAIYLRHIIYLIRIVQGYETQSLFPDNNIILTKYFHWSTLCGLFVISLKPKMLKHHTRVNFLQVFNISIMKTLPRQEFQHQFVSGKSRLHCRSVFCLIHFTINVVLHIFHTPKVLFNSIFIVSWKSITVAYNNLINRYINVSYFLIRLLRRSAPRSLQHLTNPCLPLIPRSGK